MYITYILQSEKKRVIKHNKGYSKYTKDKGSFKLIYKEDYNTRSEAKKREYYLKSLKSRKAIEKLIKNAAFV